MTSRALPLAGFLACALVVTTGGVLTALLGQPWVPLPILGALAIAALTFGALAARAAGR